MQETFGELDELQALLTRSIQQAGDFLRSSFQMPEKSLSAGQLVNRLQGICTLSFATVTANCEPRVAPTGSLFYKGHFYIPTLARSARAQHIERCAMVSLTYYDGIDFAVIVHGRATIIPNNHVYFADLEVWLRQYSHDKSGVMTWGDDGIYLRIDANVMYSFARYPERFP